MPSSPSVAGRLLSRLQRSHAWRVGLLAAGWFVLITALHYTLNMDRDRRPTVSMGYMPVITNLAAPLLDAVSARNDAGVRFKAVKFASFAEMAEALRSGNIQAAFIIAPLSIVLHQQGADVRVVYIGNRHESTLVVRNGLQAESVADLAGRTIAVPMRYSGHHLALLKLIQDSAPHGPIRIVEMNPPDMAAALAAGSLDAYFVGEPFAAQSLKTGAGDRLLYVEQVWPDFICNLLLVRQRFIDKQPAMVEALVQGAARSGLWARNNPARAAEIASRYWGQPADLVTFALTAPEQRIVFDKFLPRHEELQYMADLMVAFGLIDEGNIEGLVEDRFARRANLAGIGDLGTILRPPP
jgi:NitT/TauT family transport system substrate-binding protein